MWANTVRKMALIDLLNAGLPHTSNLCEMQLSAKHDEAKYNKTRYAYMLEEKEIDKYS